MSNAITVDVKVKGVEDAKNTVVELKKAIDSATLLAGELAEKLKGLEFQITSSQG